MEVSRLHLVNCYLSARSFLPLSYLELPLSVQYMFYLPLEAVQSLEVHLCLVMWRSYKSIRLDFLLSPCYLIWLPHYDPSMVLCYPLHIVYFWCKQITFAVLFYISCQFLFEHTFIKSNFLSCRIQRLFVFGIVSVIPSSSVQYPQPCLFLIFWSAIFDGSVSSLTLYVF